MVKECPDAKCSYFPIFNFFQYSDGLFESFYFDDLNTGLCCPTSKGGSIGSMLACSPRKFKPCLGQTTTDKFLFKRKPFTIRTWQILDQKTITKK